MWQNLTKLKFQSYSRFSIPAAKKTAPKRKKQQETDQEYVGETDSNGAASFSEDETSSAEEQLSSQIAQIAKQGGGKGKLKNATGCYFSSNI